MTALLRVDYREAELIQALQRRGVSFETASLPVGDIWLGVQEQEQKEEQEQEQGKEQEQNPATGGLVMERKRITDFEASFLDGRYREQRGRILAFCTAHRAQPLYALEGPYSSLTGRITKKAMMKLLNRLLLRYQIPIVHTYSTEETADWIEGLVEQWKEDPTSLQRTQELVKESDGIHVQKKKNASDPSTFAMSCLTQCTGVSVKMAESLVSAYPTLSAILSLTQKELEQHKVGARKVGPAVSKRLYDLLHA